MFCGRSTEKWAEGKIAGKELADVMSDFSLDLFVSDSSDVAMLRLLEYVVDVEFAD